MLSLNENSRENRRVVIGVSGGIAAYKACELVRLFRKAHWEVRVVMTKMAEAFVGPLTFESLSGNPVLRSLEAGAGDLSATAHIDLAQWADLFIVAPATANTLAKLAHGLADDALSTEALAMTCPRMLAPAMNTRMWNARVTRENLSALKRFGWHLVEPVSGDLACGEVGEGKLADPATIFAAAEAIFAPKAFRGKKVLISSGPTRSYIDDVRFITNRSSGKMGKAMAEALVAAGADVFFVTGPVDREAREIAGAQVVAVETNREMQAALEKFLPSVDLVIGTAAVADYAPAEKVKGKLKREGKLSLELLSTDDILAGLAKQRKVGQRFVGFAAETGAEKDIAKRAVEKLERKNLDMVVLNDVGRSDIGFDVVDNEVLVFTKRDIQNPVAIAKASKREIAESILPLLLGLWDGGMK